MPGASPVKVSIQEAGFFYGKFRALRSVNLEVPEKRVTALIGPSGCGKSTLLRMLNRMYDLVPGSRAEGSVMIDGENVLTTGRLLELRQRVGMVFQRPSPFPMSIRDNVAFAPSCSAGPGSGSRARSGRASRAPRSGTRSRTGSTRRRPASPAASSSASRSPAAWRWSRR